jgi:hypothetical protein
MNCEKSLRIRNEMRGISQIGQKVGGIFEYLNEASGFSQIPPGQVE